MQEIHGRVEVGGDGEEQEEEIHGRVEVTGNREEHEGRQEN